MINFSLNQLKVIVKSINIKDYEKKSEDDSINISKKKIKEITKDFSELRYGFSKSKINEFRGSL